MLLTNLHHTRSVQIIHMLIQNIAQQLQHIFYIAGSHQITRISPRAHILHRG